MAVVLNQDLPRVLRLPIYVLLKWHFRLVVFLVIIWWSCLLQFPWKIWCRAFASKHLWGRTNGWLRWFTGPESLSAWWSSRSIMSWTRIACIWRWYNLTLLKRLFISCQILWIDSKRRPSWLVSEIHITLSINIFKLFNNKTIRWNIFRA